MIVVMTANAQADLARIGDHIAVDNPDRALTFVRELRQRCETLADMPRAFPLVPRHERQGIRRRVYGGYLIFYRIRDAMIEILHVLQGARDLDAILFPDAFGPSTGG